MATGVKKDKGINRRTLLVGGGAGVGLLIAWAAWPRHYGHNLVAAPGETIFDAFLKIGEDGHVTVIVPQAEMGQGVWTSLPQALADELGADWRTIAVEPAPINPLYANKLLLEQAADGMVPGFLRGAARWAAREIATREALMITGGSSSIRAFEQRMREAGASARALLCMAAGKRWQADWRTCDTEAGFVTHGEERLRFGELAAEAAMLAPPADVLLRRPGSGGISGQPVPRIDLPSKVDGSARFTGDVRLPDMVYASVRHGPHGDSRLVGLDKPAGNKVPGLLHVFEHPRWVAAVATNWWAANQALEAMAPRFAGANPPDDRQIGRALEAALAGGEAERFVETGEGEAALNGAGRVEAAYSVPLAAHTPMEPLNATARLTGDRMELWVPTQAPGLTRAAVARAIGFGEGQVTIYPMLVGGGFGRKIENDAAEQAAILAKLSRKPVQLMWSREEETMRCRYRPPARALLTARLGPRGAIQGWCARIAAPATIGAMNRRLMPGALLPGDGAEAAAVEGANPPYAIPAVVVEHAPADIGIETGMWRSVAHSYTAFFTESFVDELAARAGIDPLSFRMQMLGGNPRLARCLNRVTAIGGWSGGERGSGQGIAAHSSFGSHVAMLAELRVRDGAVMVDRIVAAVDCGRIIHPDIVRQQIEGGIIWGMAAALGGAIGIEKGVATVRNFDGLGLPRLADIPEIRVELIESGEAPGGVGEIAVPPVAPALANALFAATGERLRDLPLRPGGTK
ncbi:aldehyde oxidase [Sphingomonas oleivorans]|uniref:Aldehyde oxidase n=1 Tax=Sphingomonas oleivorans TaxID=1735121 RepID=A0A2T5G217_9SPHN|nr:molybdopterin cofactor-binding domain-containing protein [Sphingomonas oleivorans]PTQ13199.1 aldehyde oxidase [Sphingomonas oleivorans]